MTDPRIITTTPELEAFCAGLAHEPFVTIDTEFIREKTYYPLLCLVQLGGSSGARAIDPLASGISLDPLLALLADTRVIKVFHAARQDMEIFYHLSGTLPAPIVDTQVAAQFCGFGESIAYSELVRQTLGFTIDKGSRFTDWAQRPLSERQLVYALDDVIHLREAYLALQKQLEKLGRAHWVAEEMATLTHVATYKPDPENAWRRIRYGHMKPKHLAALRAAARWREQEAMRLDIPRPRVVRDETLVEIAAVMPHDMQELHQVRGTAQIKPASANALLHGINEARKSPPESWPQLPPRPQHSGGGDAVALLSMLLSVQCRRHDILPRLVAGRDELEALAAGEADLPVLRDWRAEIFGTRAIALLRGELRLSYDPKARRAVLAGE